ncbi:TPA: hypothetical protein MAQ53_000845 [Klebsiella pneumoniae]|nr:hypothetical protein [Klebsiella pneumoniae]
MTDITELAESLKAAAIDAKELAIIARYSKGRAAAEKFYALANPNNVIALVEALEKAQLSIAELEREQEHLRPVGVMSEKAFHRLENSESRFIALWPRPGIFLPRKRPEDGVIVYARTAAAAGIKVEAE